MGDDELCCRPACLAQGAVKVGLSFQVQGAGGIVKNQNLSGLHHGPGDGQPLPLAAGQAHSPLRHYGVVTAGGRADKAIRLRCLGRGQDLIFQRAWFAPSDIFSNRNGEQLRLLQRDCHLFPKDLLAVLPYVHAVYQHRSLRHIIKAGNQVDQGSLSAAGGAHDRHRFSLAYGQINMLQYRLRCPGVGKGHIPELDRSLARGMAIRNTVLQLRLAVQQLFKALPGGHAP